MSLLAGAAKGWRRAGRTPSDAEHVTAVNFSAAKFALQGHADWRVCKQEGPAPAKHMLSISGGFCAAGARSHSALSCAAAGSAFGASTSLMGTTTGAEKPPPGAGIKTCRWKLRYHKTIMRWSQNAIG